jgi:hypothetical protein
VLDVVDVAADGSIAVSTPQPLVDLSVSCGAFYFKADPEDSNSMLLVTRAASNDFFTVFKFDRE